LVLGAIERYSLPNGLQVIVVARAGVPVADVTLAVKTAAPDPLDKAGLTDFTAQMLRKGTQKRSADQIAEAIDFVGGMLDASADEDGTVLSCHARAKDAALCFDLVGDLAQRPTFPEKEMGEVRDQLNAAVEGAKDNPQALAAEHAANLFYGDDDPRGRPLSKRSIAAIDRAALVAFHKAWFAPNNAVLAISGDVDAKAVRGLVDRAFAAWKKHEVPASPARALKAPQGMAVRIVDKPDATQSSIVIAGPGIAHKSSDFYAVRLMNFALGGGGFSSRLMKVVRSDGGKTYGASSRYVVSRDPGPFYANTFTRTSETAQTLKLVLGEIERMRGHGPTAEELKAGKGQLIGGYGLKLETGQDLAHALVAAELVGLDRDYVEKYPERLAAVTLKDAAHAAASYLTPTALVVVGRAAEVKPMLAQAGLASPEVVAYTDPVSAAERKAAKLAKGGKPVTPAEAAAGKKLLGLALVAKGGAQLAKIKDLVLSGKGTMTLQGQTLPVTLQEFLVPGQSSREELSLGPMKMVQVFSDGRGFLKQGEQVKDMPAEMAAALKKSLWRDPNFILLHAGQPGAQVRGLKQVVEKGATYDAFEVISPEGESTRVLLDRKTHLIARLVYHENEKESADELADYKPEGGVAFPRRAVRTGGDGTKLEITYEKIELNPGLKPALFAK
jgi:zinc protease